MDQLLDTIDLTQVTTVAALWAPRIFLALAALVALWLADRLIVRSLTAVFQRVKLDDTAGAFVLAVLRFGLSVIGTLAALDQLGVDTTSILASMGVVGLTLGFAAQNTLSNVISGLFIFWDRPFVLGDLVELGDVYGRVEAITLRSTRVVTNDGRMIAIPNSVIANSTVASYTNFPNLRIEIPVTVGVDSDIGKVRRELLALVEDQPGYLSEPPPSVVVKALNDYNIEVELRAWLDDETTHIRERFALRERVLECLRAAGVEMPFETIALQPLEVHSRAG